MAESSSEAQISTKAPLTPSEIEEGIKKLINFGFSGSDVKNAKSSSDGIVEKLSVGRILKSESGEGCVPFNKTNDNNNAECSKNGKPPGEEQELSPPGACRGEVSNEYSRTEGRLPRPVDAAQNLLYEKDVPPNRNVSPEKAKDPQSKKKTSKKEKKNAKKVMTAVDKYLESEESASAGETTDYDDYKSKEILLQALAKETIYPLQEKSKKFPRAQFFCRVCEWHMDKVSDCNNHISEKRHIKKMKGKAKLALESNTPPSAGDKGKTDKTENVSTVKGEKTAGKQILTSKGRMPSKDEPETEETLEESGDCEEDLDNASDEGQSGILEMTDKTNPDVLKVALEKERIFPLKKKSLRFPRARYFCRLCDYHMDTVEDCKKHVKDNRHGRRNEVSRINRKLKTMPSPCTKQIEKLDDLVQGLYEMHGMSQQETENRSAMVDKLADLLRKEEPLKDTQLSLYGSSLTGMGLKTSDVNLDLVLPGKTGQAKALTHAFQTLKENDQYTDVRNDFSAKVPCIYFTDVEYQLKCQMTIGSDLATLTSRLLQLYTLCDPRVRPLGVVLRLWAKVCKVDNQEAGTMPPYCTSLMVIHYLQSCAPPVVPFLYGTENENSDKASKLPVSDRVDFSDMKKKAEDWKSQNKDSLGALWLGMLKYYCLTFEHQHNIVSVRKNTPSRAERKWNTKRLAVEDPFSTKRNAAKSIKSFEIFEYIWDCVRKSYYYFGMPTNYAKLSKSQKKELEVQSRIQALRKTSSPVAMPEKGEGKEEVTNTGSDSCAVQKSVPSPDRAQTEIQSGSEGAGAGNSKNIDQASRNGSNGKVTTMSSNEKSDDVGKSKSDQLTGLTPGIGEEKDEEICDKSENDRPVDTIISDSTDTSKDVTDTHVATDTECDLETRIQNFAKEIVSGVLSHALSVIHISSSSDTENTELNNAQTALGTPDCESTTDSSEAPESVKSPSSKQIGAEYHYEFTENTLSDGKGPAIICVVCEKEGHLKANCPEETLPELKPLPPMTKHHLQILTSVIKQVPKDFGLSRQELRDREEIRQELETFIQELYPNARLHLFGSSHNGFGFRHSDLDLCCTFEDKPTGEDLDLVFHIEEITKKLKNHRGLYNVIPITTAKVPIVKFKHRRSQLEGDISMYNLLALHNTRMISLYASLDSRVTMLGYALKVFAKICDIGDASRGSLSSYAYTLMMLYYLQRCKPPLIPVLQELHPPGQKPERIIDGWNTWFYDDIKSMPTVWPEMGRNNQSVGELWTGLFRFYTEEFNMKDHVVCIRQLDPLTRFEKLWNGKCIAIEDPFDLGHNLGGGLSRKMNQFILQTFIYGRNLYCTPLTDIPASFHTAADYFFDKEQLTSGKPPNDRCCRVCDKIGHIAKECPVVLNRKEREERERKRKEEMKKQRDEEMRQRVLEERNQAQRGNSHQRNSNSQRQSRQGGYGNNGERDRGHVDYYQNEEERDRYPRVIRRSQSESSDHDYDRSYGGNGIYYYNTAYHRSTSVPGSAGQGHMSPSSSPRASPGGYFPQMGHQQQQHHLGNMAPSPHRYQQRQYVSGPQQPMYDNHQSMYDNRQSIPDQYQYRNHQQSPAKNARRGGNYNQVATEEDMVHPWIRQFTQAATQLPAANPNQNTQVHNGSVLLATNIPQTMVTGNIPSPYYYPMFTMVSGGQQGASAAPVVMAMPAQEGSPLQSQGSMSRNQDVRRGQYNQGMMENPPVYNLGRTVQNEYYSGNSRERNQYPPQGQSPQGQPLQGQRQYQSNHRR